MKDIQTAEAATLNDVKAAAGAYLEALEKNHTGETIGTFLYHLYKQLHVDEEIEKTSIQIAEALAALNSQYVHKHLADEMGGYWVDSFCDFLARLNKVLLYMASCKTVRASVAIQYMEHSDTPDRWSQEALCRIKKEYEIRLQRLKDGEDFE